MRARLLLLLCFIGASLAPRAFGHPMGNFSINHYAAIRVERQSIQLRYIIDMAEIPAFQEIQQSGISPKAQDPRLHAYLSARAIELAGGLHLKLDGNALPLRIVSRNVIFPPGAGNLPTLRLTFLWRAPGPDQAGCQPCELTYDDRNFAERAGWKEIIANSGPGASLVSSNVPARDRSRQLTNYSVDFLPQDLKARVLFSLSDLTPQTAIAAAPRAAAAPPNHRSNAPASAPLPAAPRSTPRNAFTELMKTPQIGPGFLLLAVFVAAGLGALHALEPGHGKTIVAAYLVGSKGAARHAFLLGIVVTISHTAGVYLLGAVTIYAEKYILPERIYPLLAVMSGIFIAGMGFYLFLQRSIPGALAYSHTHGPGGHRHMHGLFGHSHVHPVSQPAKAAPNTAPRTVFARQLLLLGITGGIVPCPAALVVLLSAATLHRVGLGLFLILCFSLGLAAVLIAMGLIAVYAGRLMTRLPVEGPAVQRWLPLASAVMITVIGCAIAVRGLLTARFSL